MSLQPIRVRPADFDPDGDTREAIDMAHEQTRYNRLTIGARSRKIRRFLQDPAAIALSALGRPLCDIDTCLNLPTPVETTQKLQDVLVSRRSSRRRDLTGQLSLQSLSNILALSLKSAKEVTPLMPASSTLRTRPYPSAGALFPCEIYVLRPEEPPYRYDVHHHALIDFGQKPFCFSVADAESGLPAPPSALVITAELDRSMKKYGGRGYRFSLLEAGHISQNLLLAATAFHVASLAYGSYFDPDLERALGLDGIDEVVCAVILLGADENLNGKSL